MKILVTGGAGYIGSAVVEQLIAAGESVSGLRQSLPGPSCGGASRQQFLLKAICRIGRRLMPLSAIIVPMP